MAATLQCGNLGKNMLRRKIGCEKVWTSLSIIGGNHAMQLRWIAFGAALFATPALAGEFQAQLVKPVSEAAPVVEDVVWRCQGTQCVTTSDTGSASAKRSCFGLVREVGPLASFSDGSTNFTADQLARCNGVAAPVKTTKP
jgi:hypothetical protein